jgi:hypothetical protein
MDKSEAKEKIVQACFKHGIFKAEEIQYIIATVEHETNGKFKPVREAYWLRNADQYLRTNRNTKRYYPYYGRGFSQITWKANYAKFEKILDIPLVEEPDLALDFDVSLEILIYGMKHGTFTGKKLSDYFNYNGSNFLDARRIINGTDKAEKIATMAQRTRIRNA